MIRIASNFTLPSQAVTETFAILGIRGSGKTNTGVVLAEELLKAKQQVVIIDPVDVWWGLKSGFPIPVIGGDHADVPLDGPAGPVLADFVVDTRASVILSLRHLSMNDQRRFAGDFAKRLYERKGSAEHRSPLMLIVDEADEFVPQRLPHGHEAMFGAFDRLVRRGRSSGIGVTLISQRAQVVNKDVLSQMETLVGMRVLHKLDRKALEAWIEAHDTGARQQEFLDSLASLGRGQAWIWSPSWLNVFQRVQIRARHTFDSSATPKAGEKVAPPKDLAPVDLEKLRESMASQIAKAEADDPRKLRARIAQLEAELKKTPAPAAPVKVERVEVPILTDEQLDRLETAAVAIARAGKAAVDAAESITGLLLEMSRKWHDLDKPPTWPPRLPAATLRPSNTAPEELRRTGRPIPQPSPPADKRQITKPANYGRSQRLSSWQLLDRSNSQLPKGELAILTACAQFHGGATPQALTQLTGYRRSSRDAYVARLVAKDLIERRNGAMVATLKGIQALPGDFQPLPTGEPLQAYWLQKLPEGESRILDILLNAGGQPVDREHIGVKAGYQRSSRDAYLSRLKARQLIETPSAGMVSAARGLFD